MAPDAMVDAIAASAALIMLSTAADGYHCRADIRRILFHSITYNGRKIFL